MKLESLLASSTLSLTDLKDPTAARELQTLLAQAGFLQQKDIDGSIGAVTLKAFDTFKSSVWLSQPELISSSSLEKLKEVAAEANRPSPSDEQEPLIKNEEIINKPVDLGKAIYIPCVKETKYTNQAIIDGGSFTWGEATHNGTRIPEDQSVVNGIVRIARKVQSYRDKVGRPFQITSWYRDRKNNARVGGAKYSRHLSGDALDILVNGYNGRELAYQFFRDWQGGLGMYRNMPNLIHVDARSGIARWGAGVPWP